MCGIAGIVIKNPDYFSRLGSILTALIRPLETRGPDSSGMALYSHDAAANTLKLLFRCDDEDALANWVEQFVSVSDRKTKSDGVLLTVRLNSERVFDLADFKHRLKQQFPAAHLVSAGQRLEIYKAVGAVENLCRHYGVDQANGSHGIAHTRMATESLVDINHCHPFTSNIDLSIVHNGQISNYYKLRFQLERAGMVFETGNDSEAIANFIYYQLLQGATLEDALSALLSQMDGTYTFLVATPEKIALVRDKYAAKPAVVYESGDLIAIASEYHALLQLPNFDPHAAIHEPNGGEVNVWSVVPTSRKLEFATP